MIIGSFCWMYSPLASPDVRDSFLQAFRLSPSSHFLVPIMLYLCSLNTVWLMAFQSIGEIIRNRLDDRGLFYSISTEPSPVLLRLTIDLAHTGRLRCPRKPGVRDLARCLHIHLRFMPAGLTDEIQPLERAVFGAMKTSCRRMFRPAISDNPLV
jgi:hypothetical protein